MSNTQNSKDKHWRDTFNSDYMASWDLDSKVTLTIKECKEQECKLAKREIKPVLHFVETVMPNGVKVKPMILNATNCKFIHLHTNEPFINKWNGFKVDIQVVDNTGKIGNAQGLRVVSVTTGQKIDITHILNSSDMAFVRAEGNKLMQQLNEEQKTQIRNHIQKLTTNV